GALLERVVHCRLLCRLSPYRLLTEPPAMLPTRTMAKLPRTCSALVFQKVAKTLATATVEVSGARWQKMNFLNFHFDQYFSLFSPSGPVLVDGKLAGAVSWGYGK